MGNEGDQLKALKCTKCGYLLEGLAIEKGIVRCPECGRLRRLAARPVRERWSIHLCTVILLALVVGTVSNILELPDEVNWVLSAIFVVLWSVDVVWVVRRPR